MRTKDGHLYLIDFGIARHFKPGQAKDTAAYGSMGYSSPEQYGKAQTTSRSDIYSLGAVLHQLLSGHDPSTTPFRLPSLQSRVPTIPHELATLITQMLELEENKRPNSMSVVKQKLQSIAAALSGQTQPTVAGKLPISTTVAVISPTSTRKKNHRLTVLMSILVGVILVSGIGLLAASHQTSSNNNLDQTQSYNSTVQQETPTSPPSTSYPRLAPSYHGSVNNTTVGGTATLDLTSIVENQQVISGSLVIGTGLCGSGTFTGTIRK